MRRKRRRKRKRKKKRKRWRRRLPVPYLEAHLPVLSSAKTGHRVCRRETPHQIALGSSGPYLHSLIKIRSKLGLS